MSYLDGRHVGFAGSTPFSAANVLERLARLQNPDECSSCEGDWRHVVAGDWPESHGPGTCRACSAIAIYGHGLCVGHQLAAEQMLREKLPALYGRLETQFGSAVDAWIERGRLHDVHWWLRSAGPMARRWAAEAFDEQMDDDDGDFDLRLIKREPGRFRDPNNPRPYWRMWAPDDRDWFIERVSLYLEAALETAVAQMPTERVERQIISALIGDGSATAGADIEEGAREFVTDSLPSSTGLGIGPDELLALRYDEDHARWLWHGWDVPYAAWRCALDLLPDWLAALVDSDADEEITA